MTGSRDAAWREAIEYLDAKNEWHAAHLLRVRLDTHRDEETASFFESADADLAAQWRTTHSDAGYYLRRLAETRARYSELVREVDEVRDVLQRNRRWHRRYEWRIGTEGSDEMRRAERGFRVSCSHNGEFSAEFATFAEAYEGLHVLSALQKHLFYALGWPDYDRAPEPSEADELAYDYLLRLLHEARDDPAAGGTASEADGTRRVVRASTRTWGDDGDTVPVFEFSASTGSLAMAATAPTPERAAEYLGVYVRLQRDLAAVLEWRWLAGTNQAK